MGFCGDAELVVDDGIESDYKRDGDGDGGGNDRSGVAALHLLSGLIAALNTLGVVLVSLGPSSVHVLVCAHHAWASPTPCVTHRLPGRSCTPPVARVAFPGVPAVADHEEYEDDDDEGGLSLYDEELGLAAADEQVESVTSTCTTV